MNHTFIPISATTKRPTASAKGFSQPGYQGVPQGPHTALRLDGFAVVDCDTYEAVAAWHGAEGTETPYIVKSHRGAHFYYRAIDSYAKSDNRSYGDIDLKTGIGSYVMAPGSVHPSGSVYTPVGHDDVTPPDPDDLPPLPALALEKFRVAVAKATIEDPGSGWDEVPDGMGHGVMTSLAGSLVNQGMNSDAIARALDSLNHALMPSAPMPQASIDNLVRSTLGFERTVIEHEEEEKGAGLATRPASSYKPKRTRWLWDGRVPLGELTIITGRPKVGKSTVMLDVLASLTRGVLRGELHGQETPVMMVATEDAIEETLIPRLIAARAKLDLVHFATEIPTLPSDIDKLFVTALAEGVRVILLDPLLSRLDRGLNADKDPDVRAALEPLVLKAHDAGITVIGVMHNNKGQSTDPLTNLMSSRAFSAVPRSILSADHDPADGSNDRLLSHVVCSVGPQAKTLAYQFDIVEVGTDDGPITASHVVWGDEDPRSTIDILQQAQQAKTERRGGDARALAISWLRTFLRDETMLKVKVTEAASDAGISPATLARAFSDVGVSDYEPGGKATWRLKTIEEIAQGGNT